MRTILLVAAMACGRPTEEPEVKEGAATPAEAPMVASPAPRVFFRSPADGASVTSPVKLAFGVEGMELRPAGDATPNSGHHHLIVSEVGVAAGTVVPADEKHIHYGQGQTEAELVLPPGTHELTMQFADGSHRSYGEPMASTITVTVTE